MQRVAADRAKNDLAQGLTDDSRIAISTVKSEQIQLSLCSQTKSYVNLAFAVL